MPAEVIPITVLFSDDMSGPIEIFDQSAALSIAVASRTDIKLLGEEWNAPGVYILIDRHGSNGEWGAYVGKAPAGVKQRLGAHIRNKDHWYRVILIRSDTTLGFNSAQVGWLEGRLFKVLSNVEGVSLHNASTPSDETLPSYDRQLLESVISSVQRVLKLIGHDIAPKKAVARGRQVGSAADASVTDSAKRFYGVSLAKIVEAGIIEPKTNLVCSRSGYSAEAKVLDDGRIECMGKEFDSLSTAAVAVRGGAANGWDFWAVRTEEGVKKLSVYRDEYLASRERENGANDGNPTP